MIKYKLKAATIAANNIRKLNERYIEVDINTIKDILIDVVDLL